MYRPTWKVFQYLEPFRLN